VPLFAAFYIRNIMSFPYLSDVVYYLTGIRLPLPFATFGILVALAALVAAACLRRELRRLHAAGRIGSARRWVKDEQGLRIAVEVDPHTLVGDFTMVVLFAGIAGARLFHILEHTDMFLQDPLSMIFSRSGLSVFGGLIVGALAGLVLLRRWRIPIRPFMDAIAPALMLGYAIGRLGCQIAGDGDWGMPADMALKPAWLPDWLWAQTYDNNIYGELIAAPGVYPPPVYESLMALGCFAVLWALRKHPFRAGWLFSAYLLLAGIERLLIEQIRVNVKFELYGVHFTQAEFIAVAFIALGVAGMALLGRRALPGVLRGTSA
jgi:phosphatidylglycerol:prolipoprotein diacylglycerol transferase